MAKKEMTRKQLLNEPDQFITFSGKLIAFGQTHMKPLLIGAGILVSLLLAVVVTRQVMDRNENRASEQVEKAMASYEQSLAKTDATSAYETVKPAFSEIFDAYGSKNAVKLIRIIYGDISYQAGDADTAIAMYTRALDDFGHNQALANVIQSGLGHAYVLKKEYPQAIEHFAAITTGKEATMKSGALFNLAAIYEITGDTEKSTALFKQLMAEFPDTIYGDLVKEKVPG